MQVKFKDAHRSEKQQRIKREFDLIEELQTMRLGDECSVGAWGVTRVLGGYIYANALGTVFVPDLTARSGQE